MSTASEFATEIVMINIIERVKTWIMPTEDEDSLSPEFKYLQPLLDNDDEDDEAILLDIIWLFDEYDTVAECIAIEEGSDNA